MSDNWISRQKDPRRQVVGLMGINTLALIIGKENVERMLDKDKNRRVAKERRHG